MKLGVDLGGTKIEIVALDEAGEVSYSKRTPTPQGDYEGTLRAIVDLFRVAEQQVGEVTGLGLGTPGTISPASGLMKNSNSTCLNGQPLLQDLQQMLGKPVRIENDANCFALSEAMDGAAKDAGIVFGVIVGTGTGAGIVINKQVLRGSNAIAGEWGHNPLPWPDESELPGIDCYCGQQGCIETVLSGPGLAHHFELEFGVALNAQQIVAGAEAGDQRCEKSMQQYEHRMARGLAHVINLIDPHVIVLGGGMSNISRLYKNVPRIWQQYIFSDAVSTRLSPPVYGDSSGVRGAAWLF